VYNSATTGLLIKAMPHIIEVMNSHFAAQTNGEEKSLFGHRRYTE